MAALVFVVLGFLLPGSPAALRVPEVADMELGIACARAILERYPSQQTLVVCVSSWCLPGVFYKGLFRAWTIQRDQWTPYSPLYRDHTYLFLQEDSNANTSEADMLYNLRPSAGAARIFVWKAGSYDHDVRRLTNFFHISWTKARLANVVVILSGKRPLVPLYTVNPYSDGGRCSDASPVLVDYWSPDGFRYNASLFSRQRIRNLYGCSVRVSTRKDLPYTNFTRISNSSKIEISGRLRDLLYTVAKGMNFTPDTRAAVLSHETSCGPGSRHELTMNRADVAIGFFSSANETEITYASSNMVDCIVWCLPELSRSRDAMFYVLQEFTSDVWQCLILSVILVSLVVRALQRPADRVPSCTLAVVALSIVQPGLLRPRSGSLRMFLAHWSMFVVVLVTAYEAALKSVNLVAPWQPRFKDVDALARSGFPLSADHTGIEKLKAAGTPGSKVHSMLAERAQQCSSNLNALLQGVVKKRNTAALAFRSRCVDFNLSEGPGKLYLFPNYCFHSGQVYFFAAPTGSPFLRSIGQLTNRLFETGLLTQWLSMDDDGRRHSVRPEPFELLDLRAHFYILSSGLILALGAFVVELWIGRGRRRRGRRIDFLY